MIETERAWHARELVSELTVQELDSYDGVVAVCSLSQSQNCILTAGLTVLVAAFKEVTVNLILLRYDAARSCVDKMCSSLEVLQC